MIAQYIVAGVVMSAMAAFVVWLQLPNGKETARRAALSSEERQKLEHAEAVWAQTYSF